MKYGAAGRKENKINMKKKDIKVCMTVICRETHKDHELWVPGMDKYIKKPLVVGYVDYDDDTALCSVGGMLLWFDIKWLEPLEGGNE